VPPRRNASPSRIASSHRSRVRSSSRFERGSGTTRWSRARVSATYSSRHASARSFPATRRSRSGPTSASRSAESFAESDPESFAESDPESFAESDAESDTDVDTVSRQRAVAQRSPASRSQSSPTPYSPPSNGGIAMSSGTSVFVGGASPRAVPARRTTGRGDRATRCRTRGQRRRRRRLGPLGSVNRAELDVVGGAGRARLRRADAGVLAERLREVDQLRRRVAIVSLPLGERLDERVQIGDPLIRIGVADAPVRIGPQRERLDYVLDVLARREPAEGVAPIAESDESAEDPRCSSPTAAGRRRAPDRGPTTETRTGPRQTRRSGETR